MCAEYLNHSLVNRIKSELRSSSGISCDFLEYFTPKATSFSNSYSRDRLKFAEDSWWKVLEDSQTAGPRHLDVAQLVKHYLGLPT